MWTRFLSAFSVKLAHKALRMLIPAAPIGLWHAWYAASPKADYARGPMTRIGAFIRTALWLFIPVSHLPRSLAGALCVLAFVLPNPAQAQSGDTLSQEVDEVTRRVLSDPFITLRFVALALETKDEQGQALNGIVRAMLARQDPEGAIREIGRIEDPLWRARSLTALAEFREYADNDIDEALNLLALAVERVLGRKPLGPGGADLLRVIANKQAALGELETAIETAGLIPDPVDRVTALQQAASANYDGADRDRKTAEIAQTVLRAAFEQAKNIEDTSQRTSHMFIDIGEALAEVDDIAAAQAAFIHTREFIARAQRTGRDGAYARLGAAMISAGQLEEAMEVMRQVQEGPQQVRGLGAVARALAEKGQTDAAPPLFVLAREVAETIEDPWLKYRAIGSLVKDQTAIGRYADAFTTAGQITDRRVQARALLEMGSILLEQGELEAAALTLDYIPYDSMRAQLMGRLALEHGRNGNKQIAQSFIARAFETTGFEIQQRFIPEAIRLILEAQLEIGDPEIDAFVFNNVRKLADKIEDELTSVAAMAHLATAEALRGETDRANRTLSGAWRNAWLNRQEKEFPTILKGIVDGQIAIGDILSAFDTAARIPSPEGEDRDERTAGGDFIAPRFASLSRVAVAAAKAGETDLAIRAAREMQYPPARAAGLAAIAVAIAEEEAGTFVEPNPTTDAAQPEAEEEEEFIEQDLFDDPFQN